MDLGDVRMYSIPDLTIYFTCLKFRFLIFEMRIRYLIKLRLNKDIYIPDSTYALNNLLNE